MFAQRVGCMFAWHYSETIPENLTLSRVVETGNEEVAGDQINEACGDDTISNGNRIQKITLALR